VIEAFSICRIWHHLFIVTCAGYGWLAAQSAYTLKKREMEGTRVELNIGGSI
jgi:hypothetical protein